jgi:anti-anti-sigma factor
MTSQLTVRIQEGTDYVVVAVQGGIFYDTAEPLRRALGTAVTAEHPHLVLDLSTVPLCDSTGANLMVHTHRTATGYGGWLRLAGAQPMVLRILQITNLTRILSVYSTVEEALSGDHPLT